MDGIGVEGDIVEIETDAAHVLVAKNKIVRSVQLSSNTKYFCFINRATDMQFITQDQADIIPRCMLKFLPDKTECVHAVSLFQNH